MGQPLGFTIELLGHYFIELVSTDFLDVCCKKEIPTKCSSGTMSPSAIHEILQLLWNSQIKTFILLVYRTLSLRARTHTHTHTDGVQHNRRAQFLTSPRQELVNSHSPKVRYLIHNSSPWGPLLKQMNPTSITTLFLQDLFF